MSLSLWNLATLRASLAEHLSDRCSDSNPTWSRLTSAVGDAGYCMLGYGLLGCGKPEFSSSLFSTRILIGSFLFSTVAFAIIPVHW